MNQPAAARVSFSRRLGRTFKGFVLWNYERGSWQYDIMVALIVAFVLLMPARFFHDQPVHSPNPAMDVMPLGADQDGERYRVSAQLLASHHDDPRQAAEEVLFENLGHPVTLARIEPIAQNGAVVWYDVWVRENDRQKSQGQPE